MFNNTGTTVTGTTDTSSVTVDNTAPVAPVISNSNQIINAASIAINGTAETGAMVSIYSGASLVATGTSNGSFSIATPLAEGANTLVAYATDAMGNVSIASNSVTITRDSMALSASITYSTTGWTSGSVVATISFNKTGVIVDNN